MVKRKNVPDTDSPLPPARTLDRFSGDPDFMLSLARGLLVLQAFEHEATLSIGTAAALTGLPRPTARRCLYTLEQLGYLSAQDGAWRLRPRLLSLARAYLSSSRFAEAAQPHLDRLRDALGESCSIGVLDGDEVVYIARAETRRIISIALQVGSHLPAYCTSMGRVLLAALPEAEAMRRLRLNPLAARTPLTLTDPDAVMGAVRRARERGHAVIDQEVELGLRSIAVPLLNARGVTVAALNLGLPTHAGDAEALVARYLPPLERVQGEIRKILR